MATVPAQLAAPSPYTHFITWEDSSTQNYSPTQYFELVPRWREHEAHKAQHRER